jgi:hypothetical protein
VRDVPAEPAQAPAAEDPESRVADSTLLQARLRSIEQRLRSLEQRTFQSAEIP